MSNLKVLKLMIQLGLPVQAKSTFGGEPKWESVYDIYQQWQNPAFASTRRINTWCKNGWTFRAKPK